MTPRQKPFKKGYANKINLAPDLPKIFGYISGLSSLVEIFPVVRSTRRIPPVKSFNVHMVIKV